MDPLFLALNLLVLLGIAVAFLWPRLRERYGAEIESPEAIRQARGDRELADVVTEWAKTTGVLSPEGEPVEETENERGASGPK